MATLDPTIERLIFVSGDRAGFVSVEADVHFIANEAAAALTVSFMVDVSDDPTFSVLQERVFQAVQQSCKPSGQPDYIVATPELPDRLLP